MAQVPHKNTNVKLHIFSHFDKWCNHFKEILCQVTEIYSSHYAPEWILIALLAFISPNSCLKL